MGFFGEFFEYWVDDRSSQSSDVTDSEPEGEEGIGHDRPISSKFVESRVKFDVGAFACGGADSRAQVSNCLNGVEVILEAVSFVHRGNDLVDESIQSDHGCFASRIEDFLF